MTRWPFLLASVVVASSLLAWLEWPRAGGGDVAAPSAAETPLEPTPPRRVPPTGPQALITASRPLSVHQFRPRLGARAAIVVDSASGEVLWAYRARARLPIASTTKIMTAVLAIERLGPRDVVAIGRSVPRVEPLREGLRVGERVPVWKLLYGLLLFSGNDSALALAIGTAGSRGAFVGLMNRRAVELGLRDTHFSTPSGVVDRHNRSSARDLAALARYAMRNPRFRAIVSTRVKRVAWPAPTYGKVYVNKNRLLTTYGGADGVKTGWTTVADHCIVASARRGGVRLIAVALGSEDAFKDARRLLNYGFRLARSRR